MAVADPQFDVHISEVILVRLADRIPNKNCHPESYPHAEALRERSKDSIGIVWAAMCRINPLNLGTSDLEIYLMYLFFILDD